MRRPHKAAFSVSSENRKEKRVRVEMKEAEAKETDTSGSEDDNECAVCCQEITYKTTLPDCGHSFCFLCIKGVALRKGACPMCRKEISGEMFKDPKLVQPAKPRSKVAEVAESSEARTSAENGDDEKEEGHWFYEGRRHGWWRYERRHELEIEKAYLSGKPMVEMLIAGYTYCIDFTALCQYRKDIGRSPGWERCIRRVIGDDASELNGVVKGIAGLRSLADDASAESGNKDKAVNQKQDRSA